MWPLRSVYFVLSIESCNVTWILSGLLCVDTKVLMQQKKQRKEQAIKKFKYLTKEIIKK